MPKQSIITHEGFFVAGYMGATRPMLRMQPLRNTTKRVSVQDYTLFTPLALQSTPCRDGVILPDATFTLAKLPSHDYMESCAFLELEGAPLGEWGVYLGFFIPPTGEVLLDEVYLATYHPTEKDTLAIRSKDGSIKTAVSFRSVAPVGQLQAFKARHPGEKHQKLVESFGLWKRQVRNQLERMVEKPEPNVLLHASDFPDADFKSMNVIVGNYEFS